ncbi:hypothetical protein RB213_008228 [Colletotrichum asianum]
MQKSKSHQRLRRAESKLRPRLARLWPLALGPSTELLRSGSEHFGSGSRFAALWSLDIWAP